MKIKRLKVRNLRSYENAEIVFPEGSVLLAGNVGSGKTTILLAIEYALFGLQAGQRGAALLRNGEEIAEVSLECEIEKKNVLIERRLKKESKSITSDYAAITIDGVKNEYSTTELKTKILGLLGYPLEFVKKTNLLYKYTVYTPQEQMKHIILEDAETRFSVLRNVFGIDKYKTIRDNASTILLRFKDEIKSLQTEVKLIESDKSLQKEVRTRLDLIDKELLETGILLNKQIQMRKLMEKETEEVGKNIREKEILEKEVEKTSILVASKQEILLNIEKEEREIDKSMKDLGIRFDKDKYISLIAQLNKEKQRRELLELSYIRTNAISQSLEHQKKEAQLKKDSVFSLAICPTCLQDVPTAHKHNILNETENKLSELKKQTEKNEEERIALNIERDNIKAEIALLEKNREDMEIQKSREQFLFQSKTKLEELSKKKEHTKKDISLLIAHLDSLKNQILRFSSFDIVYRRKSEELKQAFRHEKEIEISIAQLNKEKEILNKETERISKSIQLKEKTRTKLNNLSEISDWISSYFLVMVNFIERQVMIKLRREFSKLFSSWFNMIAGDAFEIQLDENFTPLIMQGGVEMEYAFLSGGERTAIALAYRLALNQTINSVFSTINTKDIIILDEPTEGFSEAQIDKVRDVLEQLKVEQLIIVSHEAKIEGFVDHILRISKVSDISSIDYGSINSLFNYQKP